SSGPKGGPSGREAGLHCPRRPDRSRSRRAIPGGAERTSGPAELLGWGAYSYFIYRPQIPRGCQGHFVFRQVHRPDGFDHSVLVGTLRIRSKKEILPDCIFLERAFSHSPTSETGLFSRGVRTAIFQT